MRAITNETIFTLRYTIKPVAKIIRMYYLTILKLQASDSTMNKLDHLNTDHTTNSIKKIETEAHFLGYKSTKSETQTHHDVT